MWGGAEPALYVVSFGPTGERARTTRGLSRRSELSATRFSERASPAGAALRNTAPEFRGQGNHSSGKLQPDRQCAAVGRRRRHVDLRSLPTVDGTGPGLGAPDAGGDAARFRGGEYDAACGKPQARHTPAADRAGAVGALDRQACAEEAGTRVACTR